MKLIKSELILEDFFIINSNYEFIEPKNNSINLKAVFDEYNIDIDFIVRTSSDDDNKHIILSKVSINASENKIPGYSIFAEAVSIYSFDEKSRLNTVNKSEFLWTSGVSISINSLRNYISSLTSYCPLGKYILPSVDLTKLLNQKRTYLNKKSISRK